jgi:methylmalonyl-CoA carboxyltransferase 12S subunit
LNRAQPFWSLDSHKISADGVVTGAASVDGRLIHLAGQDFTVLGGSAGEVHSNKVADLMELSLKSGSRRKSLRSIGSARETCSAGRRSWDGGL